MRAAIVGGTLALALAMPPALTAQAATRTIAPEAIERANGIVRVTIQRGTIIVRRSRDDAVHFLVRPDVDPGPGADGIIPPFSLDAGTAGIELRISPQEAREVRAARIELAVPAQVGYLRIEVVRGGQVDVDGHAGELTIVTRNGDVALRHLEGPLLVETRNGSITAAFDAVRPGMPITLMSHNGEIDLTLPGAAGRLLVESRGGGTITSAIPLVLEELPGAVSSERYRPQRGIAHLDPPGANVRTVIINGDVTIRVKK